ncbi:MAG: trypsin-like serine protease [Halieaceae bacterium]|jgi:secreted trypsin-like serine protease|nr:trypsin-like serine protease [Halieaceae bacterium]
MKRLPPLVRILPIILLLTTGWSVGLSAQSPVQGKTVLVPPQMKLGNVGPKIVGGYPSDPGNNQWIASLQYRQQHFCGAALIADRWILTAAHCVIDESASDSRFSVWVGGHNLDALAQGVRRDVTKIIMHPQYDDFTVENDIALLELESAIPGDIPRVALATVQIMSGPAAPNQPVTVSGWGALAENGGDPTVLHEVVLPVVSNSTCNAPQSYSGEITSRQICAGLRDGGKDSCFGDSGGPLWLSSAGLDYIVGIVSYGDGCARADKYGVYTRVFSYINWVEQHTGPLVADNGDENNENDDTDDNSCPVPSEGTPTTDSVLNSTEVVHNLSAQRNSTVQFTVDVQQGSRKLIIQTWAGSGDVDLYVAHGRVATTNDFDFAPYLPGNNEKVVIDVPSAGTWHVTLHAYKSFSKVKLRATIL